MNHEEQVGKNFAWGAISQVVTRVFGLAFFIFMSFVLHEKGMGQYNFISSFVVFWFILSDFGVTSYLFREWSKGSMSEEKIKKDFSLVLTLKLIIASFIFIPFLVVNWIFNQDIFLALILYFITFFISLVINQADHYFSSQNNFKFGAIRQFIEKITIIIIGALLLLIFPRVESVFVAMIIAQLISIYYYFSGRFPFGIKVTFDWVRIKELIIKGLPFVFFTLFVSLYSRVDMVMLKFMEGFEAVGLYGTAYKIFDVANIFPAVLFLPAVFPVLSRIVDSRDHEKFLEFINRLIRILFSFSIVISLFFVIYAPFIINWFFPDSFTPSVLAMRILILVLVISSLSLLFNNILIIQNKEKVVLKIVAFSCLVNVILNFILITKYSFYGAAWATVFAEVVNLLLLQYYAVWNKNYRMIGKMLGLTFLIAICLSVFKYIGLTNNVLVGSIFLLVTVLSILFLKLLSREDMEMFYLPIKNKFNSIFFNQNEI